MASSLVHPGWQRPHTAAASYPHPAARAAAATDPRPSPQRGHVRGAGCGTVAGAPIPGKDAPHDVAGSGGTDKRGGPRLAGDSPPRLPWQQLQSSSGSGRTSATSASMGHCGRDGGCRHHSIVFITALRSGACGRRLTTQEPPHVEGW